MPVSDPLVELQHVSFAYDERPILTDISMRFPRGRLIAVMGGSGSGKTTVLRLIGGLLKASGGDVRFDGRSLARARPSDIFDMRRRMGMLFQFGALFTDLSAFDNVAFPLREHTDLDEPLIRDLVLMKLQAVGLRGSAQLKPAQVSGGMARRIALARAIALDPQLVMYDEPFAGLDPISMGMTATLIRTLNNALAATSIIVSHDVNETFAIADYVYFIASGRIAAEGTPAELRTSTDPFVRQFVDGAPDGPVPFHMPALPIAEELGL